MCTLIGYLTAEIRRRWQLVRDNKDGGYSTETVLVTALLVTLALVVMALIYAKVVSKAGSINLS